MSDDNINCLVHCLITCHELSLPEETKQRRLNPEVENMIYQSMTMEYQELGPIPTFKKLKNFVKKYEIQQDVYLYERQKTCCWCTKVVQLSPEEIYKDLTMYIQSIKPFFKLDVSH